MVTVEREGNYLNYMRDGHVFYDPAIPAPAEVGRFMRDMGNKMWFGQDLKRQTLEIIRQAHGDQEDAA